TRRRAGPGRRRRTAGSPPRKSIRKRIARASCFDRRAVAEPQHAVGARDHGGGGAPRAPPPAAPRAARAPGGEGGGARARGAGGGGGGSAGDRGGHGAALLLAGGERVGKAAGRARDAGALERRRDARPPLGCAHAAEGERQVDVLGRRQRRAEIVLGKEQAEA